MTNCGAGTLSGVISLIDGLCDSSDDVMGSVESIPLSVTGFYNTIDPMVSHQDQSMVRSAIRLSHELSY